MNGLGWISLSGVDGFTIDGVPAEQAVASLANHTDFEDFREGWLRWLSPPSSLKSCALPLVLMVQDEFATDPLLAYRPDLARYTRLGDLLLQAGRPKAALVEYGKAVDPDSPASPLLFSRRAQCHAELDEPRKALDETREGVRLYPEFAPLHVLHGQLLQQVDRDRDALHAMKRAHDLNPYDPVVQQALAGLYEQFGDESAAKSHQRYLHILVTGLPQKRANRDFTQREDGLDDAALFDELSGVRQQLLDASRLESWGNKRSLIKC